VPKPILATSNRAHGVAERCEFSDEGLTDTGACAGHEGGCAVVLLHGEYFGELELA
jgi:hypothetical protein